MNNLATCYWSLRQLDKSIPLFEDLLKRQAAAGGRQHPRTLQIAANLGINYKDAGRLTEALPLLEESYRAGKKNPKLRRFGVQLLDGYAQAKKTTEVTALAKELLDDSRHTLPPESPALAGKLADLGSALRAAGKHDLALPLFEETLRLRKAKLGPDHPDTLNAMSYLAAGYRDVGKLDRAVPILEEHLRLSQARLGPDHPHTLIAMGNLALGYRDAGKLDQALPLFEEALRFQKAKLGPENPQTIRSMNNLAVTNATLRQWDKSIPLYEEALKRQAAVRGRQHPETVHIAADLGVSYKDASRLAEALPLLEEGYRASNSDPELRWVGVQLLDAYARAKKTTEFTALVKELLDDARRTLPGDSPALAGKLANLGSVLLTAKAFANAEPLLRECLSIRERKEPDDWTTFNTQSLLGGALLGRNQFAAAEPLLLAGYEGMKKREKTMQPVNRSRLAQAADRLVDLYTATKRPDEVRRWQAERALYPEERNPPLSEKK
jgi:tetratricopeptide (TPR) repeat protein